MEISTTNTGPGKTVAGPASKSIPVPAPEVSEGLLSSMRNGQECLVIDVLPQAPERQRLMEIGFVPGSTVIVLSSSDPMIVRLNGGSKLAIRKDMAGDIVILPS